MPTLIIDNLSVSVPEGSSVLEAAEKLGIMVPHFCYHHALGAVGACRMCAVTILEGTPRGLQMACLVNAADGMEVSTLEEKGRQFRQHVGEWLMTNHPHDCPVCDEGGECQLQEMTISAGQGIRRYRGRKRTYQNQDLGPFISQEMNRCIQCYRCVRTYQDYFGGRDFGVMGSRQRVFFGRFQDGMLESDFSGNLVDVCPTGVFTDRTFRYKSRYWDLEQAPSICPHCSLGCATRPGGRNRELQRLQSGINQQTNDYFICDRGRFGSGHVNHPDRPRQARIEGRPASHLEAIEHLLDKVENVVANFGPQAVAFVGSSRASLEANWLLGQWSRQLGCPAPVYDVHPQRSENSRIAAAYNIDRLASLAQVRASDLVLVVGGDPLAEAPVLGAALRQVVRGGGRVVVLDPRPIELPCEFEHQVMTPDQLVDLLHEDPRDHDFKMLCQQLAEAQRPVLVGGGDLLGGIGLQRLEQLAERCSNEERSCLVHPLLAGPNSFGAALLSGSGPQDLLEVLEAGAVKMLICLESDPSLEHPASGRMQAALARLDCLAVFDCLATRVNRRADLFVPTTTVFESDGCFVNNEGRMQVFARVMRPGLPIRVTGEGGHPPRDFPAQTPGAEPRMAWQLLQQLLGHKGSLVDLRKSMEQSDLRLAGLSEILPGDSGYRINKGLEEVIIIPAEPPRFHDGELLLLPVTARYGSDLASSLSEKLHPRLSAPVVMIHPSEAARRHLCDGDTVRLITGQCSIQLPLVYEESMARGLVLVPSLPGTVTEPLVPGGMPVFCEISKEVP